MTKRFVLMVMAAVLATPVFGQSKPAAPATATAPATAPAVVLAPELRELVEKLPAEGGAAGYPVIDAIYALGQAKLAELAAGVQPPGSAEDVKVRFAIHGLAMRAGSDAAKRKVLSDTLVVRLKEGQDPQVKGFFIEQLELAGAVEAAPAIAGCLLEKDVTPYAVRALVLLKQGQPELLAALPRAEGRARLEIISALGTFPGNKALPALRKLASDGDVETRLAAMLSLAEAGDGDSADMLLRASAVDNAYERARATDAVVRLAEQLAAAGNAGAAEKIYRGLWSQAGKEGRAARIAGFQGLAGLLGEKSMPQLLEAMESDDVQLRAVAVRVGGALPGEKVTQFWAGQLEKSKNQADILNLLGARNDAAAFPAVAARLAATDTPTLIAAIRASAALGQAKAVPVLVPFLIHSHSDVKATAGAALTAIPGRETNAILAMSLVPGEPASTKAAILSLLAARGAKDQQSTIIGMTRDKDETVRVAAYNALDPLADESLAPTLIAGALAGSDAEKSAAERALIATLRRVQDDQSRARPVLDALAKADETGKPVLARILGQIGGKRAIETLLGMVGDKSADTQDMAIRALAKSSDPIAMATLLDLARSAPKTTHQVLSLQGYLRLLGAQQGMPGDEKVKLFVAAFPIAKRPEEQRTILAGLGGIASTASLEAVTAHFDEPPLQNEAHVAAVKICEKIIWRDLAIAQPVLEKIIATTKDAAIKKQATDVLAPHTRKKK